jgi:hypothetical protein
MAYSDFTLSAVLHHFNLKHDDKTNLFPNVKEVPLNPGLQRTLKYNTRMALGASTEKARSEFIIAPVLSELNIMAEDRISIFSGVDFTIEPEKGLNGACDFIISKSPDQTVITAPLLMIVEAKNENILKGLGQCAASMIAARLFNEREANLTPVIYGAVTTGEIWKFLRLQDSLLQTDKISYYIQDLEKVFGIFLNIFELDTAIVV